jgi:hypothetical protein
MDINSLKTELFDIVEEQSAIAQRIQQLEKLKQQKYQQLQAAKLEASTEPEAKKKAK